MSVIENWYKGEVSDLKSADRAAIEFKKMIEGQGIDILYYAFDEVNKEYKDSIILKGLFEYLPEKIIDGIVQDRISIITFSTVSVKQANIIPSEKDKLIVFSKSYMIKPEGISYVDRNNLSTSVIDGSFAVVINAVTKGGMSLGENIR